MDQKFPEDAGVRVRDVLSDVLCFVGASVLCLLTLTACQSGEPKAAEQTTAKTAFVAYADRGLSKQEILQSREVKPGLRVEVLREGRGAELRSGHKVFFHFTAWIERPLKKFDSTIDRGQYLVYVYGEHSVNPGFELGVAGMRVGELRRVFIAAEMAYGATGAGPVPPNSDLIYEVELMALSGSK